MATPIRGSKNMVFQEVYNEAAERAGLKGAISSMPSSEELEPIRAMAVAAIVAGAAQHGCLSVEVTEAISEILASTTVADLERRVQSGSSLVLLLTPSQKARVMAAAIALAKSTTTHLSQAVARVLQGCE